MTEMCRSCGHHTNHKKFYEGGQGIYKCQDCGHEHS